MASMTELESIADDLYKEMPDGLDTNERGIVLSLMMQRQADELLGVD